MEAIFTIGDDMVKVKSVMRRRRPNGVSMDDQCQQCTAMTPNAILFVPSWEKMEIILSCLWVFPWSSLLLCAPILQS